MRYLALGCLLMLLGLLLGGLVGGAIGHRLDAETARSIEAEGEIADFLPVVTFLAVCMRAAVGVFTALVISLLPFVLRKRTMKPRPPFEFEWHPQSRRLHVLTLWSISPRWGGSPCDYSSSASSSFFRWHAGLRCFRSASVNPCREGT
jgi:hypothetical protein